jgi:hypothetical protein
MSKADISLLYNAFKIWGDTHWAASEGWQRAYCKLWAITDADCIAEAIEACWRGF